MTRGPLTNCRCCAGLSSTTYCNQCKNHHAQHDATVQAVILATFGTEGLARYQTALRGPAPHRPARNHTRKGIMNGDTIITVTGNLVDDPELRFTPQGQPVTRFRIASVPRFFDKAANEWKDGDSLFLTVTAWKQQAENICESLNKGTRAVITGRLRQRSYETKQGDKRTVYEIEADDVAASLKFATAKVAKAARPAASQQQGQPRSTASQQQAQRHADPWANASPTGFSDEPPF